MYGRNAADQGVQSACDASVGSAYMHTGYLSPDKLCRCHIYRTAGLKAVAHDALCVGLHHGQHGNCQYKYDLFHRPIHNKV